MSINILSDPKLYKNSICVLKCHFYYYYDLMIDYNSGNYYYDYCCHCYAKNTLIHLIMPESVVHLIVSYLPYKIAGKTYLNTNTTR
uniref:CPXV211 protein n=1 Tax=Schistosoma curassoni TaxID=6186 RepID=A0A183KFX2_9TREM